MRIGLLGGTFDPIHVGHLDVARAACRALSLDRLLLMPSHVPPHRGVPHASPSHRFAMAVLATQHESWLEVSDLELADAAPSFTSTTLDRLAAAGEDTRRLFFVTGADAFHEIRTWKDYPGLLDRCHFIVVSRPDWPAGALRPALPELASRLCDAPCEIPARPSIFLVDAPTAPVSSTDIRRRIAEGLEIRGLVPPAVEAHILKHRLYGHHAPIRNART